MRPATAGRALNASPAGPDCRRSEPAEMRPLMMKSTSKGRGERKRNLMVSMIDGCFRSMRSGGRVHCFCGPELCHQPPSPPRSSMWIRARRLFNSSFERRVDQGESGGRGLGCGGVVWQGVCAVPLRDVPRGTVPGCAAGRRDRASPAD